MINYTLRERTSRLGEGAVRAIAHRLPYKIRYWTYIDFAVQHLHPDDVVPEVRMTEILQRSR